MKFQPQSASYRAPEYSNRETGNRNDYVGALAGNSKAMQEIFHRIQKISHSRCSVLILGETGTGKELVARSIHEMGPHKGRPFVTVDCGGIAPTLIESELFGHVRGAFTGAESSKQGLVEAANGGTLFLDEVAELPTCLQTRLLRACQEKEFRLVGSTKPVRFEARIIAATNEDLEASVARGTFRKDLYFRLNVVSLVLPPLRERREDIPLLAGELLSRLSLFPNSNQEDISCAISAEALRCLMAYDWPGNVRELENSLCYALTLGEGLPIQVKDLPIALRYSSRGKVLRGPPGAFSLAAVERQAIMQALAEAEGDKQLAARLLGIGKTTLYRKLKEYKGSPNRCSAPIHALT